MKNFDWKIFATALLVLLPILLAIDIAYDKIFKTLDFHETFALKNIVFKVLAAAVGAYFYATYKNEDGE